MLFQRHVIRLVRPCEPETAGGVWKMAFLGLLEDLFAHSSSSSQLLHRIKIENWMQLEPYKHIYGARFFYFLFLIYIYIVADWLIKR